jgi:hypothetical protein
MLPSEVQLYKPISPAVIATTGDASGSINIISDVVRIFRNLAATIVIIIPFHQIE